MVSIIWIEADDVLMTIVVAFWERMVEVIVALYSWMSGGICVCQVVWFACQGIFGTPYIEPLYT